MKIFQFIAVLTLVLIVAPAAQAQNTGKYIPTKFDTIKKKIPPQVYGRQVKADPSKPIIKETPKVDSVPVKKIEAPIEVPVEQKKNESPVIKETPKPIDVKKEPKIKISKPRNNNNTEDSKKSDEFESLKPPPPPPPIKPVNGKWTLQNCIQYAMDNNLQVAESELNERLARLMLQQNRNSRLPSLNGDASLGESYGRSIDPTSNQFVTKGFMYNNLGLSSQTLLFGWFQRKHQLEQNQLEVQAANASYNQLKNDIALNVATGYLRVLLAREQVRITESQLKVDNEQYNQTVIFANAGKVPELNVAQMLSQLSTDSSNLVSAVSNERIALLQLRALMNFNFEQDFDIIAPSIDLVELASLYSLPNPEGIFNTALKNYYRVKFDELKLLSAKKTLDIAKAVQYPQLSLLGSLGTNYASTIKDITGQTYTGESVLGNIKIGETEYPITRSTYTYQTRTRGLFNQYGDNIRANIGLGLSVPIFNGFSANTNIQKAKIGLIAQQITIDRDKQTLKQDIYKAYEEAKAASQKYSAAKRAQDAAQRAMDFAVKRFAIGMISTYEYTLSQSSLFNASSTVLSTKYDLIFKLKVLDYYMGNPLKL